MKQQGTQRPKRQQASNPFLMNPGRRMLSSFQQHTWCCSCRAHSLGNQSIQRPAHSATSILAPLGGDAGWSHWSHQALGILCCPTVALGWLVAARTISDLILAQPPDKSLDRPVVTAISAAGSIRPLNTTQTMLFNTKKSWKMMRF